MRANLNRLQATRFLDFRATHSSLKIYKKSCFWLGSMETSHGVSSMLLMLLVFDAKCMSYESVMCAL